MSLLKLKSGTDIRGTAVGENTELTDEAIRKIAFAFISYLCEKTGVPKGEITLAVGHDSRISAERIKNALLEVFSAENIKVYDCGLSSTPAMFMTTLILGVTASVQITASHHPYDKNGLKFFTKDGGFEGEDIKAILEIAEKTEEVKTAAPEAVKTDFMSQYCEILRKKIVEGINDGEKPLSGFKIVVDAGNGAGGFFKKLLDSLGADTNGSQFLEPDGMFPNHIPNPEDKTAMGFISRAVTENEADLGIIFDTDVDRAACVDNNGREINRNALIALSSVIALENSKGGTIVTDSVTSSGLRDFINEHLGGVHYRYKRGYKNVINKAIELNSQGIDCPLAIETSGHAALRENYFLDDGAYLMVKIIILMANLRKEGKTLSDLLAPLRVPKEEKEVRYIIDLADFKEYGEGIIKDFEEYCEQFPLITPADDNREGFRVNFGKWNGDGWLLIRMSVHDPVIPVNFESESEGGVEKIERFFNGFISKYDKLRRKV
ncbi:MAG: phosphomannomutase/phosphoglucomutase [Clostridia bacterium]|nr:phosphomannomutase/phosphoglucomutase [Clostridia bacterium]